MSKASRIIFFLAAFFSLSCLYAQEQLQADQKQDPDNFDMDALRRWIRDKRLVTVKEIGGDLSISGEVRTEFQNTSEQRNGVAQRGHNAATSRPSRAWDVEVNLMLDYRMERIWASVKLEFDDDMGILDGTMNKIALERAYFGGRIVAGDTFTFDAELGRRSALLNVFDSKVEYGSLYDGMLLRFNKAFASIGDFYTLLGITLVDEKKDYYAYIGEIGMLKIGNTGLIMKLSYVDWKKYSIDWKEVAKRPPGDLRFNFRVSQLIVAYQFTKWGKFFKFYAAGLYNDAADRLPLTGNRKLNGAWYAGVSIGLVRKKGDWAVETNYQWVQAQAIPDFDASGIGRGNAAGVGFYTLNINGTGGPTTRATAVGKTNYKGWVIEALYAFTNNLTLQQSFAISRTLDKTVGPDLKYMQYEAEFIYAF